MQIGKYCARDCFHQLLPQHELEQRVKKAEETEGRDLAKYFDALVDMMKKVFVEEHVRRPTAQDLLCEDVMLEGTHTHRIHMHTHTTSAHTPTHKHTTCDRSHTHLMHLHTHTHTTVVHKYITSMYSNSGRETVLLLQFQIQYILLKKITFYAHCTNTDKGVALAILFDRS